MRNYRADRAIFFKACRLLGSPQLTILILLLMAVLVIAGTLFQARRGIYAAQQQVFGSWIFWAFGFFPVPGMRLAGAFFIIQLLAAFACRLPFRWRNCGLWLIHAGLLLLAGGAFFIAATSQETFLTLREGESRRFSEVAGEWEIAMALPGAETALGVVDVAALKEGRRLPLSVLGLEVTMKTNYANCRLLPAAAAGARRLEPLSPAPDPAENIPGISLVIAAGRDRKQIDLVGGESLPQTLEHDGRELTFTLRPKRFYLPLELKLLDFSMSMYPRSDIPRSFSSRVEIVSGSIRRQAVIAMNKPLRFHEYAIYQSAYGVEPGQKESSTFAIVCSRGRWLPYIASALLFFGMICHFLGGFSGGRARRKRVEAAP